MYHWRTWLIVGMLYIFLNVGFGYLHCADNFCPGDREEDWVYEYTDDDGKRMVMSNGKTMTKEQWQIETTGAMR